MGERDEPGLQAVIEAMATLRRRCPWSSRQDHQSLEKYAREETDELIAALEDFATEPTAENRAAVVDELGDVFYQVLFHSALLEPLHNPLMSQLVSAMWLIHQARAPRLHAASKEHLLASAEAHAAILRACESGDVDAYRKAIEDHYLPLLSLIGTAPAAHGPDPSPQHREHSRGTDEQAQGE